jgi:hypothetical protein
VGPATHALHSPPRPVLLFLQGGDLNGALEKLLALEKKTRLGADSASTARVAVEIVRRCWEARNLEQLTAHVLIVAKRRSQLKQAIADMVKEAMSYIDAVTNKDDKVALVTTLRTVTDGKIYVEVRAPRQLGGGNGLGEAAASCGWVVPCGAPPLIPPPPALSNPNHAPTQTGGARAADDDAVQDPRGGGQGGRGVGDPAGGGGGDVWLHGEAREGRVPAGAGEGARAREGE